MIYNEANFPELPRSWASLTVDDSVDGAGNSNKKLKTKDALDHGRFPVIDQGKSDISGYSDDESLVVDASELSPIILFGDHTRLLKQILQPFVPGADGTKLFRAKSFWDTRFVYQMLRAIKLPDKGYARHFQYLRDSVLPLPPINEQKRIADKLDAVLARVDACHDRLDRIPAILKSFRQSVLAAATSGKLTEDWSGHAPFSEIALGEIARWSSGGTPSRSKPHYYGGGIPWVKTGELRENIITSTEETLTEDGLKNSSAKLFPRETVLIAMYGATIGRVALLGIEAATNQACAAAVANLGMVTSQYLVLLLQAEKANLVAKGQGGAQPNISQGVIKEHVVMLPEVVEQNEIVRRVEVLFAFTVRLEARYRVARAQVEKLTPATLAKAFRGELVPQDTNDEPASVLLERIRATKNVNPDTRDRAKSTRSTPQLTDKHQ